MVLGKTSSAWAVLLIWLIVGHGLTALAVGACVGLFGHFFLTSPFLFVFPLFGRRLDIDGNTVSKAAKS